ncbi:MAG: FtsW/RodA/SpoVE family cell cycle protein [Prosthecobacter sp.]|uniref:FtsW/RodA/SpoVE family cell cycle protein n=1 Tax=Prosthecobacter sp. TaxID=1965333 RepID=UPI003900509F
MAKHSIFLLILAVVSLIALGITMLASTTFEIAQEGGEDYVTLWRQIVWLGVSLVACVIAAVLDYNVWLRWRWHILITAAVLLALCYVPMIGVKINGSKRWIGLQSLRVQPSEFAKIALIIALAGWYATHEAMTRTFVRGFLLPGLLLSAIVALIGCEFDLGSALLAAAVGLGVMFIAGTKLRYLAIIVLLCGGGLWAGITYLPNRLERVMVVFDLEKHKEDLGLQQWVSKLAFGSGGIEGRGLGEGRMKLSYLPEAHTDFIFPMVGEELGLRGTAAVVLAFAVLVMAGMVVSSYAPNRFGKLLGAGVTFLLGMEALLNMGVTTALLPNKGLPLPFVSYGGSSLVAAMVAVGILINIHRQGVHLTWDQLPVIRRKRRWTPQL